MVKNVIGGIIGIICYFVFGWIAKDICFSMLDWETTTTQMYWEYEAIIYCAITMIILGIIIAIRKGGFDFWISLVVILGAICGFIVNCLPISLGTAILLNIINIGAIIVSVIADV